MKTYEAIGALQKGPLDNRVVVLAEDGTEIAIDRVVVSENLTIIYPKERIARIRGWEHSVEDLMGHIIEVDEEITKLRRELGHERTRS